MFQRLLENGGDLVVELFTAGEETGGWLKRKAGLRGWWL